MVSGDCPLIVHVIHSLGGGGTERTLVSLLRAFDPLRARHAVVTLRGAGPLAEKLPDHLACRALGARGASRRVWLDLAVALREYRATVVHARNPGCWFDATMASLVVPGTQLVLGFHGLETTGPFTWRQRWVARLAQLSGARFTSVSECGRHQLHAWAGVKPERIDVLRNGIDVDRYRDSNSEDRRRIRDDLHMDVDAFVVGTVGSLTPIKCHDVLIRAGACAREKHPNLHLLIVGDGPLRTSLEKQAQEAGIADRVHFAGWREDVPAYLSSMDAYACSSASEGMSNAVLEAMAAGLPIIATNVGDNPLIVRNEIEGRIVPPNDPDAIAGALCQLVNRGELRDRYATAAKARANDLRFDQVIEAYETYYEARTHAPGAVTGIAGRNCPSPQPA